MKLALYIVVILGTIGGVFFAGYNHGVEKTEFKYDKQQIRKTDDDIKTNTKISDIGASRDLYNLNGRLQRGTF